MEEKESFGEVEKKGNWFMNKQFFCLVEQFFSLQFAHFTPEKKGEISMEIEVLFFHFFYIFFFFFPSYLGLSMFFLFYYYYYYFQTK